MEELTPDQLKEILGPEVIAKIYEDALSKPTKELSKTATEVLKTFRLFLAPFQIGAAYQDRFSSYLDRVRNSVPEERQVPSAPHIAGPVLEKLKYIEDNNYLKDLYLNLLKRAIDKDRINEAHPAFITIIDQLSPDEALLIKQIANSERNLSLKYWQDTIVEVGGIHNEELIEHTFSTDNVSFPENLELYINHLNYLNLIELKEYRVGQPDKSKDEQPIRMYRMVLLTRFGRMFYSACVS